MTVNIIDVFSQITARKLQYQFSDFHVGSFLIKSDFQLKSILMILINWMGISMLSHQTVLIFTVLN